MGDIINKKDIPPSNTTKKTKQQQNTNLIKTALTVTPSPHHI